MNLLMPNIYDECRNDSPAFRENLGCSLKKISDFYDTLKEVSDQFTECFNLGVRFACSLQKLSEKNLKLKTFYTGSAPDVEMQECIKQISEFYSVFHKHLMNLMETMNANKKEMTRSLQSQNNIEGLRKSFVKSSDSLDLAILRSTAASKNKIGDCEEADKARDIAWSDFRDQNTKIVSELDKFGKSRGVELLGVFSRIIEAISKFYAEGYEFSEKNSRDWRTGMATLHDSLTGQLQQRNQQEQKLTRKESENKKMEGYLFRAPSRKTWGNKWQKRWYVVEGGKLICYKRELLGSTGGGGGGGSAKKRSSVSETLVCEDLRMVTARRRPDSDVADVDEGISSSTSGMGRRWCLELMGPGVAGGAQIVLQAQSGVEADSWVQWLSGGMGRDMGSLSRKGSCISVSVSGKCDNCFTIDGGCGSDNIGRDRDSTATSTGAAGSVLRDNTGLLRSGMSSSTSTTVSKDSKSLGICRSESDVNLHQQHSAQKVDSILVTKVTQIAGNKYCCECGAEKPRWVSVSLGITLCTECGGAHRSLGVHISKVRSMLLDNWEPEMLAVMFLLGNETVNRIYESDAEAIQLARDSDIYRPDSESPMNVRQIWVQAKWRDRKFISNHVLDDVIAEYRGILTNSDDIDCDDDNDDNDDDDDHHIERMDDDSGGGGGGGTNGTTTTYLEEGINAKCLPLMMIGLAKEEPINGSKHCLPLMLAAEVGFWPAIQFLVLNGARTDKDYPESSRRTALHVACERSQVLSVWLLLKLGAKQNITDQTTGHTPLEAAIETTNANTVTLLRLQALNEHTKETNFGSSGDETFNNVFSDFTATAYKELSSWVDNNFSSSQLPTDKVQLNKLPISSANRLVKSFKLTNHEKSAMS